VEKFTVHSGRALPLRRSNVDTDQIIPAEYLKRVTRTGFEDGLFAAWRKDPAFVLNQPQYAGATILVAGPDFGTGSSREHAVWALMDYGFRVVLSPRFADIFRGNSGKAGLLTAVVDQEHLERLWAHLEGAPATEVTVDLVAREVRWNSESAPFDIDDYTRWRLMEGLDDIGLTLRHEELVTEFEQKRPAWLPRTLPARSEEQPAG
jgi:3-isopropylmalate/(R)-2-methylmalate dehydratase small subunit